MGMAWFLSYCHTFGGPDQNIWVYPVDTTGPFTLGEIADVLGVEVQPAEKIGYDEPGENSYNYNVSHLYKYDFVKQYYGENK